MNLQGVGRRYGLTGPWVLRGVHLHLAPGTLVRIEGTNGGGKSTLLRLAAGIDAPTEGVVTGRPARTAYVPERFPAALPFTAAGYLVHLGRIHGLRRAEAAARADRWLERFGAGAHARTPLAELSKGTSQKVAVAQALLAEPDLLVLDEAWTGLDTAARAELDLAVGERVAAGGTVLFVDHDPRRLAGRADAVYAMEGGRPVPRPAPRADAGVVVVASGADAGVVVVASGAGEAPGADAGVVVVASGGRLTGSRPLPGAPGHRTAPDGTVTFTVAAAHSDALLRELLTSRPAWHIHRVSPAGSTAEAAPVPRTTRSPHA
ncbi:ATP-binding cassette domain-containing protein [Streptomyces sp. NPDC015131]|uniref:ATP-binding cassette domain-containing protein n=1 Tax=Streptomyces sp. NPDC015131 TaxID=3364941 RepID=UPI0036F725BA